MKNHPVYKKYLVSKEGIIKNKVTGKTLKQSSNNQGYLRVSLYCEKDNKWIQRKVHRLVAETYLPNPHSKREVNHKDGIKNHNDVSNLEWVTSKENKRHAWDMGLYNSVGENHPQTSLSNETVTDICIKMEQGYRNKEICELFSLQKHIVADIRSGRRWKHISKDFNIKVKRKHRKSPDKIIEIAMMLEKGDSISYISQKTGVKDYDIRRVKRREIFSDITSNFKF